VDRNLGWRARREQRRRIPELTEAYLDANRHHAELAAPLRADLDHRHETAVRSRARAALAADRQKQWLDQHPEHTQRLDALNRQVRTLQGLIRQAERTERQMERAADPRLDRGLGLER
jgi:hypothetical protein